ncbi:MAG: 4a-hydroxytetrahydrobiopterin dehydratase [Alphaproteobacteria bacterium]|nr:4a-hydroxytetrahydrobiopterin dehydratase [Alphaproteobacteria bacterium]HPF46082.1 4a-hydroxytetrahydrobiopterin dehydratase [Emcibacteraceae bacterium]HRW30446.1 4a-hydroxytetrahydrobiopterin dehydratase [Emcibacteraceae bacterium]
MYKKMTLEDILSKLNGWKAVQGREAISKKFTFKNFDQAFAAMTKIAKKAEEMDHHPEWFNVYNRLEVTLATHDANGVTSYDLELAKFIDAVST